MGGGGFSPRDPLNFNSKGDMCEQCLQYVLMLYMLGTWPKWALSKIAREIRGDISYLGTGKI